MRKQEILEVLYKMKADFEQVLVKRSCSTGFCGWFICQNYYSITISDFIIDELQKDSLGLVRKNFYWYPIYLNNASFEISNQPRIDHLNRTTSRLENEIKNESYEY